MNRMKNIGLILCGLVLGLTLKFSRGAGSGIAESDTVDQPHPCGR